jgi:disulfide bond formation protein DsbB
MTPVGTVLAPSPGARGLWIAAVSAAIHAAVLIFQAFGYAPSERCLAQRFAIVAGFVIAIKVF